MRLYDQPRNARAFSALIDQKLEPINDRLTVIDIKQDRNNRNIKDLELKLEELNTNMKLSNRNLQKQINRGSNC